MWKENADTGGSCYFFLVCIFDQVERYVTCFNLHSAETIFDLLTKEAQFSELSKLCNSVRTCDCIQPMWDTARLISKDSCSQPFGKQNQQLCQLYNRKGWTVVLCASSFFRRKMVLTHQWNSMPKEKKCDELCVLTWKKCHANQTLLLPDPSICKAYHTVEMLAWTSLRCTPFRCLQHSQKPWKFCFFLKHV